MASGDQGEAVAVTQARGRLGFGRSSSVEKRVNWRYTLERKSTGLAPGRGEKRRTNTLKCLAYTTRTYLFIEMEKPGGVGGGCSGWSGRNQKFRIS